MLRELTFVIEPIYTIDASTFVIATQQEKILRIFDLVGKKQANCLQRLFASVNIIAKEQVVGFGWKSTILEQTKQVGILTVYVSCKAKNIIIMDQD